MKQYDFQQTLQNLYMNRNVVTVGLVWKDPQLCPSPVEQYLHGEEREAQGLEGIKLSGVSSFLEQMSLWVS